MLSLEWATYVTKPQLRLRNNYGIRTRKIIKATAQENQREAVSSAVFACTDVHKTTPNKIVVLKVFKRPQLLTEQQRTVYDFFFGGGSKLS